MIKLNNCIIVYGFRRYSRSTFNAFIRLQFQLNENLKNNWTIYYNHPEGQLCPLSGITPGNLAIPWPLLRYSSSGVCDDPVAWLLEDELYNNGSLEDIPVAICDWPAFVTLSSVVDGVKVVAFVGGGISTESCCDCVCSCLCINCTTSGTRVGTLEALLSTCETLH